MANTRPLKHTTPADPPAEPLVRVHTKKHAWAPRVKRLLYSKTQVNPGVSRFVIDAEIEPYRVYYRQQGAVRGDGDEAMLAWFYDQPE